MFLSDTGLLTPHPPTTHPFHCSPISPSIFLSRLLACCCFCSMNPRYHDAVRISQMFSASFLRSVFRTSISHTFIFVFRMFRLCNAKSVSKFIYVQVCSNIATHVTFSHYSIFNVDHHNTSCFFRHILAQFGSRLRSLCVLVRIFQTFRRELVQVCSMSVRQFCLRKSKKNKRCVRLNDNAGNEHFQEEQV